MNDRQSMGKKMESRAAGIADSVQDLIRDAKPAMHRASEQVIDQFGEWSDQGEKAARQFKRQVQRKGRDMRVQAADMISDEPFKAVAIAAGVGAVSVLLIDFLWGGRR